MRIAFVCIVAALCGCAGGPTKDYYSPILHGQKFTKPITIVLVEDVPAEKERRVKEGYIAIGASDYFGKYPEAVELRAQARRVGANHIIYGCERIPAQPGAWRFAFGNWGGGGGSVGDQFKVQIVFLGR